MTPVEAVENEVHTHGPVSPKQADAIVEAVGVPILAQKPGLAGVAPGLGLYVEDGSDKSIREERQALATRVQGLIRALKHVNTIMREPELEAVEWPRASVASLDAVLGPAVEWLTTFREEWARCRVIKTQG